MAGSALYRAPTPTIQLVVIKKLPPLIRTFSCRLWHLGVNVINCGDRIYTTYLSMQIAIIRPVLHVDK